jgi:hypothetical protein
MSVEKKLEDLFKIIVNEAKTNQAFSDKLENLLNNNKKVPKKSRKRAPAVLNPETVLSEGEEVLRGKLAELDIEQLKDIVSDFGMDPSKLVMKWKKTEKIIDHIVETSLNRSRKGDAFRK